MIKRAHSRLSLRSFLRPLLGIGVLTLLLLYLIRNWSNVQQSIEAVSETSPTYFVVAILLTLLTFLFAARAYTSLAVKKISYREMLLIEFAATAINRILPAGLGGIGVHGVYLFKRGHTKTAATAVVSANTLLGFLAHNVLLLGALLLSPLAISTINFPDTHGILLFCLLLIGVVAGGVIFRKHASAIKNNIAKTLGTYRAQPSKLVVATFSLMAITLTNFTIFMLACDALQLAIPLVPGFLIYSFGVLVGAATPTPGGLAGVEAGLVAGLLGQGAAEVTAIAVVLAFRFVTFWLPLVPAILSLGYARKQKIL